MDLFLNSSNPSKKNPPTLPPLPLDPQPPPISLVQPLASLPASLPSGTTVPRFPPTSRLAGLLPHGRRATSPNGRRASPSPWPARSYPAVGSRPAPTANAANCPGAPPAPSPPGCRCRHSSPPRSNLAGHRRTRGSAATLSSRITRGSAATVSSRVTRGPPPSHPLPVDGSPSLDPRPSSTSSSRWGSVTEAPKQFTVATLGRSTTHHLTARTVATAVPRSTLPPCSDVGTIRALSATGVALFPQPYG
ncbi:proline-rich receptor-like protein kinase PERK2 isoform X2 [Triticum dicoccoides]|uniref:proline-rich receptor-like protein kinase PERK2 isoform X2 n=1 Tax=Triticum dicoccoides TaxID=85692 RepID=UPI00188F6C2F|nr:proline-rich receptor-like protein kinase PERK2 isoform X2 [Triticum dicoccoides]